MSPMKPIGDQNISAEEKKVTNEAYWWPKNHCRRKKGHQWSLLV